MALENPESWSTDEDVGSRSSESTWPGSCKRDAYPDKIATFEQLSLGGESSDLMGFDRLATEGKVEPGEPEPTHHPVKAPDGDRLKLGVKS